MRRISFLLALLILLGALPALAALDADLVLVQGSDWKRVLPVYVASAKAPGKGEALAELPPVLLWSQGEERWTRALVARLAPKRVVWIGPPGSWSEALGLPKDVRRLETPPEGPNLALLEAAFGPEDRARRVWVSDGGHVGGAIAAAALAATEQAPLLISTGNLPATLRRAGDLARRLHAAEVVVVGAGDAEKLAAQAGGKVRLLSPRRVLALYNEKVKGSRHLVTVAPSDASGGFFASRHSVAALPYLLGKGASLAWIGTREGEDPGPEAAALRLEAEGHGPFDFVTIVGDRTAIPMEDTRDIDQVAKGARKPRIHKLPPFLSASGAPSDRAVGRLAALDVYDLSRWIARILHPARLPDDGKGALILANLDEKFVLGETISRTSAAELRNSGVPVKSFYRKEITPERVQSELDRHALVLWEGHPRDLALDDDSLPLPMAPLPPSTYFLQGCYTLDRSDPHLLVERGANAVIGSYMAVYSASGSGFARAFLNAQLHRGATAGEALAAGRNFLLATVELKKRRGHKDWRKTLRAALSFDLWGDPTAPPPFEVKKPRLPPVQSRLRGDRLQVQIPRRMLPEARTERYYAQGRPGAVHSAIYWREDDGDRRLMELFFVEVPIPEALGNAVQVESALPAESFAWVFSPRSRILSLLIHESALDRREAGGTLHFRLLPADTEAKTDAASAP